MGRAFASLYERASPLIGVAVIALVAAMGTTTQALGAPAPPPTDAPASKARGPVPKDIRIWAGLIQQDYPRGVLSAGQKATVMVRAIVDSLGKVTDCVIVQTSGLAPLDEAACNGMRRYATFQPAIDASGEPTTGTWSTRITYVDNSSPPAVPAGLDNKTT